MTAVEYETFEEIDADGIVHLFDDRSAGFPLCGKNWYGVPASARVPCGYCREAASRERRARKAEAE